MGYEREAITTDQGQPVRPQTEMREEKVFSPYTPSASRLTEARQKAEDRLKIGQPSTNKTTEVPAEPGTEQEATVKLSPAAAALARREATFRREQQELKAQKAALELERAKNAEALAFKEALEKKDFASIESKLPYDEYTNYLIEKGAGTSPEQEEIKKLSAKQDELEKKIQDDVSKRFEAQVTERRMAVKKLVETDPSFKIIKKAGFEEHVVQHILDTWENDSVDLSVEDAAKEVEEFLKERAQKWADLAKDAEPTPETTGAKELPPLKPKVTTLTNNMTATGEITRPKKSFQGMTDAERYAEARRRAEEKLKQGR